MKPPILRMPDTEGLYRLMSDTSIVATGAALYQRQDNRFYIVGYNSKKLPSAAKNYSITELELFGLVINIFAFRQLLEGPYFECYCDHSAITYILTSKKKIATRRLEKLIDYLLPFNFIVHYLPGCKMHIADLLSRLAGKDLDPPDRLIPIAFNAMQSQMPVRFSQRLKTKAIQNKQPTSTLKPSSVPLSYNPQVLVKRLPQIDGATSLNQIALPYNKTKSVAPVKRNLHAINTDKIVPKKTDVRKSNTKPKLNKPHIIYHQKACDTDTSRLSTPVLHKSPKHQAHSSHTAR